jgi:uncharacterized membrane protein YdjX (TVP38/TMEM64 family)
LRTTVLTRAFVVAALVLVGSLVGWSYAHGGIVYVLLDSALTADQKVDALRAFFDRFGAAAPIAYVGMVVLEVVIAPIPGTMLYAPGGVIFGGFWGGLLSLAGNVIGAGIACQSMRVFFGDRTERFFARSALARYEELIARRGAWVVFLLGGISAPREPLHFVGHRFLRRRAHESVGSEPDAGHARGNGALVLCPVLFG